MKRILQIDYNYYVIPDNALLDALLDAILNAFSQPVRREYISNYNEMVFRDRPKPSITVELVEDSAINPPIPAEQEPSL